MERIYVADHHYEDQFYSKEPLAFGEYDNCVFRNCDFSNSSIRQSSFIDCTFEMCNLSNVELTGTGFRNIVFNNSKLFGLHFEDCNSIGFAVQFNNCKLNHSSFYRMTIDRTLFAHSILQEVDFTECSAKKVTFDNCDLTDAIFNHTNLKEADFRNARSYTLNPNHNTIRQAKFSAPEVFGLLRDYQITIE